MKIDLMIRLDLLPAAADALKCLQAETPVNGSAGQAATERDAMLPAILDRAFKGEL